MRGKRRETRHVGLGGVQGQRRTVRRVKSASRNTAPTNDSRKHRAVNRCKSLVDCGECACATQQASDGKGRPRSSSLQLNNGLFNF